jgi:DNA-binding transcriptional LysR family regulator
VAHAEIGRDFVDLLVPSGHRLADRRAVRLAQAKDDRWISAKAGDICHEWLLRVLPGVRPDFHVGEFETQLTLIAAGLGIAVIPRLARPPLPDGVCVVPLRPEPHRRVVLAWREASAARPAITAAVTAMREAWSRQSGQAADDLAQGRVGAAGT